MQDPIKGTPNTDKGAMRLPEELASHSQYLAYV